MESKHLPIALKAVQAGGKLAMKYFDNPPNVRTKIMQADGVKNKREGKESWVEPLSDVDVEIEEIVKRVILDHFPAHSFKGEETAYYEGNSKFTWYLDPISGSYNYIHKTPHFSISLALTRNDEPTLGVVLDPFYNELFWSEKGKGAFLNGEKIKVSRCPILKGAFGLPPKNLWPIPEEQIKSTRSIGSSALQMVWIAAGRFDYLVADHVDLYSQLGAAVIIQEAGGKVTDFKNQKLATNSQTIIASNGLLHQEIFKGLSKQKNARITN